MILNTGFQYRSSNLEIKKGRIVGYNIKKCYLPKDDFDSKLHTIQYDLQRYILYGLFIHVKIENGDQYDMVFDTFGQECQSEVILDSICHEPPVKIINNIRWNQLKKLIKEAKNNKKLSKKFRNNYIYQMEYIYHPTILRVMNVCDADELVNLMNKEVEISVIKDSPDINNIKRMVFSLKGINSTYSIQPILVDVNTNNEFINNYIQEYLRKYPFLNIPNYIKNIQN